MDKVRNLREEEDFSVGGYSRAERLTKKQIDCLPSGQKKQMLSYLFCILYTGYGVWGCFYEQLGINTA